jgi:hypothetical protein
LEARRRRKGAGEALQRIDSNCIAHVGDLWKEMCPPIESHIKETQNQRQRRRRRRGRRRRRRNRGQKMELCLGY